MLSKHLTALQWSKLNSSTFIRQFKHNRALAAKIEINSIGTWDAHWYVYGASGSLQNISSLVVAKEYCDKALLEFDVSLSNTNVFYDYDVGDFIIVIENTDALLDYKHQKFTPEQLKSGDVVLILTRSEEHFGDYFIIQTKSLTKFGPRYVRFKIYRTQYDV